MKDLIPRYHELFKPTLLAMIELGGSAALQECNEKVAEVMSLGDDLMQVEYASGNGAILPDRMSWARSYLKGAGYLESGGRGIWVLTDAGREAASFSDETLKSEVMARTKPAKPVNIQPMPQSSDQMPADSENPQLDWRDDLLAKLMTMSPSAFERLAQRLLRESGFVKVEVTGKSGDGGIDGTGILQISLMSFHVLFQCKRYQGTVGSGAIRDFRGAMMGRTDKGLVITTGTFSQDARREATRDGAPPIDLIDGEALCEKLKELRLGVSVALVETVTVLPSWFDEI